MSFTKYMFPIYIAVSIQQCSLLEVIDLPTQAHEKASDEIPLNTTTTPKTLEVGLENDILTIKNENNLEDEIGVEDSPVYPKVRTSKAHNYYVKRRFLDPRAPNEVPYPRAEGYEDEKDANLKTKISTLVQQTIHDSERKIKSVNPIKEKHRDEAPYKAGFLLSMIKKSRDVLNELFNVAVKHKDEWKALEQLKIFELIVHTNVDTTNLVRQLVEIHIQHLNSTNSEGAQVGRKRVVLL